MISPRHNGQLVPWTSPWTGELTGFEVRREHYLGDRFAICQRDAMGEGAPIFGSAHYQRQRQAIVQGRCDVCGKLIGRGSARVLLHPGNKLKGTDEIGHVMAASHRECARQAAAVCPWIIGEIEGGRLTVTVAIKTRVALAILDPEIVEAEVGRRFDFPVVGHAKLIVDKAMHRDAEWLLRDVTPAEIANA